MLLCHSTYPYAIQNIWAFQLWCDTQVVWNWKTSPEHTKSLFQYTCKMKHKLPLSLSVIGQQNIFKDSQFIITSASEGTFPEHSVLGEQIKNKAITVLHSMALQIQDSSLALILSLHRSYRHTLAALLETENCASTERTLQVQNRKTESGNIFTTVLLTVETHFYCCQ